MPNYRKNTQRKRTAGTFRPDRAKRRANVESVSSVPTPPEHLGELAGEEWRQLAPVVCKQRTLTHADLRGFEMLCETLATARQAQAVIEKKGLTINANGSTRAHPAIKILEAARAQATRLLVEYGLTPRARGHVEPASDTTPDNPFARLHR